MEFYFETSIMKFGILIGLFAILILFLGIYFDLRNKNNGQDVDVKTAILENKGYHISVKIFIILILLLTLKAVPDVIEYYANLVKVDEFYVVELTSNNAGTDFLHVSGVNETKLRTRIYGEMQEIVEDFFVGHLCEIEYEIFSKTVRRIKVIE